MRCKGNRGEGDGKESKGKLELIIESRGGEKFKFLLVLNRTTEVLFLILFHNGCEFNFFLKINKLVLYTYLFNIFGTVFLLL